MGSKDRFTVSLLFLLSQPVLSKADVHSSSNGSGSSGCQMTLILNITLTDSFHFGDGGNRPDVGGLSHLTILHVPLAGKNGSGHFISGPF